MIPQKCPRAGDPSNWIRALAASTKTLQLVPSIQVAAHNVLSLQLLGDLGPVSMDIHIPKQTSLTLTLY